MEPVFVRQPRIFALDNEAVNDKEKHWLVDQIHERNFPPPEAIRQKPANTNIVHSGLTQSGKSTGSAKLIVGCGDNSFIPSLKNHPAFTGDDRTSWQSHLSISPLPLVKAIQHDLRVMSCNGTDGDRCARYRGPRHNASKAHLMFDGRELAPGSFWLLDEPVDVDSLDYWSVVLRVLGKLVTMYAFMGVNLIVLSPVKDKILGRLVSLCHLWIDQKSPGHSAVWSMVPWTEIKTSRRKQVMKPIYRCSINDERDPPSEWLERYPVIKTYNADVTAEDSIALLEKKGLYA